MKDFKAIGHVFVEDAYIISYPLMRKNLAEAKKIFKRMGFFVGKPWLSVRVDRITDFLAGQGSLSPEAFIEETGLDIITWIWEADEDDYPSYIRQFLHGTGPLAVVMSKEEQYERFQQNKRAKSVWIALEKSIAKNMKKITDLLMDIAGSVADRLKDSDEHSVLEFVVDVFKESDIDAY